jgi:DNA gyrase subunit A
VNGEPKIMALREILQHFITHRLRVIVRRTEFDLGKAVERERSQHCFQQHPQRRR